jgi:hypothetical protein
MGPAPLDGNAIAGDLAGVFAFDATTAIVTCATCRCRQPLAVLGAHLRAPGPVLRCAACGAVQLRLVHGPRRTCLDLRGIDLIEIPLPDGGS